jgi:hypothetical protein
MRCLYCGKPLPLLKKLTGGGEFCSDAHRHKYQEEYNKLALSRLLQAQSAPGEVGVFPAGGGSGLRQLAAPAAPQPIAGQRALPPPTSAPAAPPTAHHQEARSVFKEDRSGLRPTPPPRAMAPPPPPPPPQPDPKEAPFLIHQHQAIGPMQPARIAATLAFCFETQKPLLVEHVSAAIPFDWDSVQSAIAASQEPDPPEAPAWSHPIPIQAPGEAAPASRAAFPAELFTSSPVFPVHGEVSLGARFPRAIRPKIHLPIEKEVVRVVNGSLRFSGVRDWELHPQAPAWQPSFVAIGAPPPVARPTSPTEASTTAEPAQAAPAQVPEVVAPPVAPPPPSSHVEVFVDLSALGIFE